MSEHITQEITELEQRRWNAMLANDLATLDALLAPELAYTHSSSVLDDKQSYIASIRSGRVRYRSAERSDTQVRVMSEQLAFVTGRARILVSVDGQDKTIYMRYSNVWVKQPGGWRFALWHSTPAPQAG